MNNSAGYRYGLALCLLLLAFVGRVLAQLVQLWRPITALPPFEAWHSGALPYPLLVATQILIIGLGLVAIAQIARGGRPSARLGRWLLILGAVYLAIMAARLTLGLTLLRGIPWFTAHLPTAFHAVLAAFLLVLGAYHLRAAQAERLSDRG